MDKTLKLWTAAVSSTLCKLSCSDCHRLYGSSDCPTDCWATEDTFSPGNELYQFIQRVTDKLRRLPDDNTPFCMEVAEDDLINILRECANE